VVEPVEQMLEAATTPAVERAVARLLGAPRDIAEAAVAVVEGQERLADGVLLLAVTGAARWGTDAIGALRRLAEGADAPGGWSDYEVRVAAEEAGDEIRLALSGLGAGDGVADVAGADAPLLAVEALQAGFRPRPSTSTGGAGVEARVAHAWIARLCGAIGLPFESSLPPPEPELSGERTLIVRSERYLDALP
jgi:hypothetical protein